MVNDSKAFDSFGNTVTSVIKYEINLTRVINKL